jgi:hypothetical protein
VDTSTPGHFTFTVSTTDTLGNSRSISNTYDVTAGDVATTLPADSPATVSTDPGGIGPSVAVPIQTTVQFRTPAGPATPVSIDLHAPTIVPPGGYAILGSQVDIDLNGVTRPASDPIVITFVIDSSTGADPATIAIERTNSDASVDVAGACTTAGIASPDPCFDAAFVAGPGSDVRVRIYTTHASKWLALRRTDVSPPVINRALTGTLGSNGWYRTNVGIAWSVTDAQSAILSSTGCGPVSITTDTAGTTVTCSATSAGGSASKSVTVKRDATLPTVTCQAATFVVGTNGAKVSAVVTDATSGPGAAQINVSADTSTAGRKSVSLTGRDRAGNTRTVSCSYLVGYRLNGLKPNPGTDVKRGNTFRVEFAVRDAGGNTISDSIARGLVSSCSARVLVGPGTPAPTCAKYDDRADRFYLDVNTSKTMSTGAYPITVNVVAGTDVFAMGSTSVDIVR